MQTTLSNKEIEYIKKIVLQAGKIACKAQQKTLTVKRKHDTSIVTEVDIAVQKFIIKKIKQKFPEASLVHEEEFDREKREISEDSLTFIIDPIDGTAMFSMYLPIWCISIGVFSGYRPLYGFVYAPLAGMFFYNNNDNAYLNGSILELDNDLSIDNQSNIFFASEINESFTINFEGKIRNLGSTALQACLVADNNRNRTIVFIGKAYLWDWAGAVPVILKAGGSLKYIDGSELDIKEIVDNDYALPRFLMAYNSVTYDDLKKVFIPVA